MTPPIRSCVGCRGRADKADLLRIVWRAGLLVDVRQTEPGRGAYLHRSNECLEQAIKRRALVRALRLRGQARGVDPIALRAAVARCLDGAPESAERGDFA